jgi:hypothetical protein
MRWIFSSSSSTVSAAAARLAQQRVAVCVQMQMARMGVVSRGARSVKTGEVGWMRECIATGIAEALAGGGGGGISRGVRSRLGVLLKPAHVAPPRGF